MAVELAQAYLSLVVDTRQIPGQVKEGLNRAKPAATQAGRDMGSDMAKSTGATFRSGLSSVLTNQAGRNMGSEMAKGVGETFRSGVGSALSSVPFAGIVTNTLGRGLIGGATAAAATAGTLVSAALVKGFDRLTAIDDAKGKLVGLGHDAASVATIMDSALASVKGTAFGLGDAATIAASAVAAGIKPGEELTKYLKLTADASAIAGTNLSDMGQIMNKVQTANKAYTDDLYQLSDRGLPIFQWLREEYNTTAEGLQKMVEKGEVDAAHLQHAIETHIGGAAQKMGNTFKGSISNFNAALGRLGAGFMEPFFKRLQGGANDGTTSLDKLTPKVAELGKALDHKIFDEWGPKLKKGFDDLKSNPAAQKFMSDMKDAFTEIGKTAKDSAPAVAGIATSLASGAATGGALGFATAVKTAASALDALSPILKAVSGFMQDHQGIVTALVTTYLSMKAISSVQGYMQGFSNSLEDFNKKADKAGGKAALLGQGIGKLAIGGAVTGLAALSQGTDDFGRKTDTAQASTLALNALLGGMAGATLGPAGAVAGAAAGTGLALVQMFQQSSVEAKRLDDLLRSQVDSMDKLTGKATKQTIDNTAKYLNDHGSRINQAAGFGIDRNTFVNAAAGMNEGARQEINDQLISAITSSKMVQTRAKWANASADDYARALEGQQQFIDKLKLSKDELNTVRDELKDNPLAQSAVDTARAMNEQADANFKASQSAQQFIRDTDGQYEATDQLKDKLRELGDVSLKTPRKNVVEITAPPGADPADFLKRVNDLHLGLSELETDGKTVKLILDDGPFQNTLTKVEQQKIADKTVTINAIIGNQQAVNQVQGQVAGPMGLFPQTRAKGGPIFGAGGPTSDSVPALLSANEHVWTAEETAAVGGHSAMRNLRSMALAGGLRFAQGGTPFGIQEAVKAAQGAEGHQYLWGGVGPDRFDCSGFVGFLQQVAMGLGRLAKRIYTTDSILGGATAGLQPGLGPAGTWFQVGVSREHMAATIAGMPAESGGALGTSGIGGGRAGATDSQFPFKFHLPNEAIKGFTSLMQGGKLVEWSDEDERELQRLQIAVATAQKKRDEVYKKSDATPEDKQSADLDVQDAQDKVVKKQKQKDDAANGVIEGGERVAPQAPALQKHYNEQESSYARATQKLEQANKRRNEVYDDPTSTDADKAVADADWQDAYDEVQNGDSETGKPTSVKSIFTNFASSVAGIAFDAFKEQLPDQIGQSHWWDVADKAVDAYSKIDGDKKTTGGGLLGMLGSHSFGAEDFLHQLGYNPSRPVPEWAQKMKAPKVYDTGGWLMPGEMGINLSSKPEPIFNSPDQLRQFAGGQLQAPAKSLTEADVEKIMRLRPEYHLHVADQSEAMQRVRVEQSRQAMSFTRR